MRSRAHTLRTILALLAIHAAAPLAAAQAPASSRVGRPEFGLVGGVFVLFPTVGGQVSVPVARSVAIEGLVEYVPFILDEVPSQHFLVQPQLRYTFRRGGRWRWHATAGTTFFIRVSNELRSRFDPATGAFTSRRVREFSVGDPRAITAGIGAERTLRGGRRCRWDIQAIVPIWPGPIPIPRGSFAIVF